MRENDFNFSAHYLYFALLDGVEGLLFHLGN